MRSDFSLNKSAVRTKNSSLNMPADQHNFMGSGYVFFFIILYIKKKTT